MARKQRLPPSASSLSTSMRDIGYTLETAIADLVDNSISAGATTVNIVCDVTRPDPALVIIDNGKGMSNEETIAAMRHGATNPKQPRAPDDLGRFGLGLKTASFSQCRRLTVASTRDGLLSGAEWNLDLVDETDDWIITIYEPDEIAGLPFVDCLGEQGTIIIWRSLDRLFGNEIGKRRDEIVNEKLGVTERHLALVFHRFLSGEIKRWEKLSISINGLNIEPFDPFCRKNPATQILPKEVVRVSGTSIHMQPYILPHHSRLSATEYDYYQNRSDFISCQGAYIYRNGRLMAWGDWFRLISKGEATKLARVQIDFSNDLDKYWTIDIKKSSAKPPHVVRERLRQIIDHITGRSTSVHRKRGKKLFDEIKGPVWERYADQGCIRYTLNNSHSLIQGLTEYIDDNGRAKLDLLLHAIVASLPIDMIYSDYATHPREMRQPSTNEDAIIERLRALKTCLFNSNRGDAEKFREVMRSTRLFENHLNIAENFIREEFK